MTEFKVGDKVIVTTNDYSISGQRILSKGFVGVITMIFPAAHAGGNYQIDDKTWIFGRALELEKRKIKVGSTYLTPTGLKRKVVFSDKKTVLWEDPQGINRGITVPHSASKWTEMPPEEWVNLSWRGDINRTIDVSSKKFSTDVEAMNDVISGVKANGYIRTVRVDEKYNTSSV